MAWVVDTSVVLDLVVTNSPWRTASLACLRQHLADGLCVCPVTFVEVGPAFGGDSQAAETFFQVVPISTSEPWTAADTERAHRLWNDHQVRRRAVQTPKRPVADVLIAAFASRFQGIITRNAADFRNIAPTLTIIEP
jgi:predicted nucleic acid-binding protein